MSSDVAVNTDWQLDFSRSILNLTTQQPVEMKYLYKNPEVIG
jgi:hypothetical protein